MKEVSLQAPVLFLLSLKALLFITGKRTDQSYALEMLAYHQVQKLKNGSRSSASPSVSGCYTHTSAAARKHCTTSSGAQDIHRITQWRSRTKSGRRWGQGKTDSCWIPTPASKAGCSGEDMGGGFLQELLCNMALVSRAICGSKSKASKP